MGLGVDTGDLDRNIVDIGLLQCVDRILIAAVGLFIAEHHLTEQVYVLSDVLLVALCQVAGQTGSGSIQDDARGVRAQALLDDRDGDGIEQIAKRLVHLEEPGVALVEELGHSILIDEHLDAARELTVVADLRTLIEHLHQELLVAGTLYHRGIHILFAALGRCDTLLTGVVESHQPRLYFFNSGLLHNHVVYGVVKY